MAAYLHPNSQAFAKRVSSPYFVDKSRLLIELNACVDDVDRKYVCISRPRRFGKTVTAQMLCAYYDRGVDNSRLFDQLQVGVEGSQIRLKKSENSTTTAQTEVEDIYRKHLNHYDVIFISMATEYSSAGNSVANLKEQLEQKIGAELKEHFPGAVKAESSKLWDMLSDVYSQYRQQYKEEHKDAEGAAAEILVPGQFVFIIDEWDSVIRSSRDSPQEIKDYLDFLRDLFKDRDYIALTYLTGILPIKKYGDHSALNMFDEYSVTSPGRFAPYLGFIKDEVTALCTANSMSLEEMTHWYDGYTIGRAGHIFNPNSVCKALSTGECDCYWTRTESWEAISPYIENNLEGLRDEVIRLIAGQSVRAETEAFENDMTTFKTRDDVLTLLAHLGYLTADNDVKGKKRFRMLRIPNFEIKEQFESTIARSARYKKTAQAIARSEELLSALLAGDASKVAAGVAQAHMENVSVIRYNDENSLSCVLTLAFYSARDRYTLIRELPTGKGFADLVFIPRPGVDTPALLIELKYDHSAESAISQIKEKHYPQALEAYRGNLILAGISYDKDSKEHSCVIERA
ncbi:MAG: AAA family ATPase [Succinivibrio sp.]|nr:AAA family ATPase [Succinivibrio sp.]